MMMMTKIQNDRSCVRTVTLDLKLQLYHFILSSSGKLSD